MLSILSILLATLAFGQASDPPKVPAQDQPGDVAYAHLDRAYEALRAKEYEAAIAAFEQAIALAPDRPSIHKDLAYALLKVGENTRARDHFAEAWRLDPSDAHVALEYAFLCYETGQPIIARRTFARVLASQGVTQGIDAVTAAVVRDAFENVDRPLREGIARWKEALLANPNDFSGHEELARLAEQRDETALAAEHFEKAWKLRPERRGLLLDLGRNWKALGRVEEANAALLAASRGAEPRVAEQARELLPSRYPYVYEFQKALELDPTNTGLRRELAYLHMAMGQDADAERQFASVVDASPRDLQAAAQLGLLLLKNGDDASAEPFLQKVLAGNDPALVDRVREARRARQALKERPPEPVSAAASDAKQMGVKSLEKGYTQDALRYLAVAHENDPGDFEVMLKLGWTNNILKRDREASRWFDQARKSPDAEIAAEASQAYRNLQPEVERFRTTVWISPMFSTRWHDLFAYSQVKTEVRMPGLSWLHLYGSVRFVGDTHPADRFAIGWAPQYLSENSVILGAGIATSPWHGATGWFEAGESFHFRPEPLDTSTATPDYRGGVSFTRGIARQSSVAGKWFAETNDDLVYVYRFDNDTLAYSQNRVGHALPAVLGSAQFYWNWNITFDVKREYWANFMETGPGVRFHVRGAPKSMLFSVNALRGEYFIMAGNPHPQVFDDLRIGVWYAFTR